MFPNWTLQPCFENYFVNQYLSLYLLSARSTRLYLFPYLSSSFQSLTASMSHPDFLQFAAFSTPLSSSFPPYVQVLSIVQSKSLPLAPLAELTVHFYRTSLIPLCCQSQEGKHRERARKKRKGTSSQENTCHITHPTYLLY